MSARLVLTALWSHWWRNPWQLVTLLAGIALSTALWSGVQAINAEARASYAAASGVLDAADLARVQRRDGAALTVENYVDLRRLGWPVSPVKEGRVSLGERDFRVIGIDPLTFPSTLPTSADAQNAFAGMIGEAQIAFAHPDDVSDLSGLGIETRADPARARGSVLMDIGAAQRILGGASDIQRLLLSPVTPLNLPDLPDAYQMVRADVQTDVARLTKSFHLNLTAFGLLSFAVGIFIVYSAVGLAFEQRRGVFRTLRALGVSLRQLLMMLVLELGLFALAAGACGVALGYVIAAALLPDVAATLRGLYGAEVVGQLQLRPSWWLSGLAMAIGGAGVAGFAALYKLSTMPLLSFNHPRAMSLGAARAGQGLVALALCLFVVAGLLAAVGDGLLTGFALLACLLIGAAFCLPFLLASCLRWAETLSQSVIAQWFWADSRQQLPGLSMALMALLLAMAANIGVSTMVSSFRITFVDYLDQRLASELYLRVEDEQSAEAVLEFLAHTDADVLPIISIETRIGDLPAEVFGMVDHATYRENWPLLQATSTVWDDLAAGGAALASEQLARREGWQVGQDLPTGDKLVGIYSDYGNAAGQMILGRSTFLERYPDVPQVRFGIRTADPSVLAEQLRNRFNLGQESLINNSELKRISIQVFERTFAVTAALNVLTLSVAGLAIFISLLTLATMRLPQLAPVWALGLTRRRLSRLELLRALCFAAATSVVALPVGLVLAWVLLAVVNVEAFGWRLPMYVFPLEYARLALLTVAAAFFAALWPAFRLARVETQALLGVFTNER